MKRLAILGASGHGKVLADCAELCGWDEVVFFDDAWPAKQHNGRWPILGDTDRLLGALSGFAGVMVAIGNNAIRLNKIKTLLEEGANLPVLIHPAATVSRYAVLGPGSVVFAGAVVNADCAIGSGVIINTGATVDHDCVLHDCVHISPGSHLAGGVTVGELSWVGIGASVVQLVSIGREATLGAGAVLLSNMPDGVTAVGVPAQVI